MERIVFICFKSVCDLLAVQNLKIEKLEKNILYFSQVFQNSLQDFSVAVEEKVGFYEISKLLDKKISKNDLNFLLANKPSFQDLKIIESKFVKAEDLNKIYEELLKR